MYETMEIPEIPVEVKVFVDKKKKRVMFAEAGADFVDTLLSFFTLPSGTIARLLRNHSGSKDVKVGSLTSLYDSVKSLNGKHFTNDCVKRLLVNPERSSESISRKLKVNLNILNPSVSYCHGDSVFVKSFANFFITDDLSVVPAMLDTSIAFFSSLGVGNINLLEERTMDFGVEEFVNLLKWSLLTNNPFTNMVFGGGKPRSTCVANSTLSNSDLTSSNSRKAKTLKLLVQKSTKKVLCAQMEMENLFVDLLFSFLTIPLGAVIRLTKDGLSPTGIINLYNSVSILGDKKYLKSEDAKTLLLSPKIALLYNCMTKFLPINVNKKNPMPFLKEQAPFIVSDDLEIIASSSISKFATGNTLNVPVDDMEILEVSFGETEALLLLKASLTSTSALTDFLNAALKIPKVESS